MIRLSEMSLAELKTIARSQGLQAKGDKRHRATWVAALEATEYVQRADGGCLVVANGADARSDSAIRHTADEDVACSHGGPCAWPLDLVYSR